MGLLSLLLFWLPLVGPFIAGFVGGHKAGRVGTALLAAAMPAILLALLVVLVAALFGLPLVGVLAGAALFVFVVVHSVPLFLGALAGAVIWPA